MILIMVAIVGVLATILAMAEFYGGDWSDVAENIAPISIAIAFFALVMGGIALWRR